MRITRSISIHDDEIRIRCLPASGPGGQNVNKVASAVQLRFDVKRSPSLSDEVRCRLIRLAGKRVSPKGVLTIKAQRYRTQERNRRDALDRLAGWVRRAAEKPTPRRPTKPTAASRARRRETKSQRSRVKQLRRAVDGGDG